MGCVAMRWLPVVALCVALVGSVGSVSLGEIMVNFDDMAAWEQYNKPNGLR